MFNLALDGQLLKPFPFCIRPEALLESDRCRRAREGDTNSTGKRRVVAAGTAAEVVVAVSGGANASIRRWLRAAKRAKASAGPSAGPISMSSVGLRATVTAGDN